MFSFPSKIRLISILLILSKSCLKAETTESTSPFASEETYGDIQFEELPGRDLTYPITYVLFYQSVGLGLLSTLDEETNNFQAFSFDNFRDGFRQAPSKDDDKFIWNFVLHPLWGSETYLRARSQKFTQFESFLFSTASSVVWEYGMENFVQAPSRQDLILTSGLGYFLGEFRYRTKQSLLEKEGKRYRMAEVLIDPLQIFTEKIGRMLGQDWREPAYTKGRYTRSTMTLNIAPVITDNNIGFALNGRLEF